MSRILPAYLLQGISFSIQGKIILDEISLSIPSNSITGIIGPNGSGKSTLAKIMTGHLVDYKGNIHSFGENIRLLSSDELAKTRSYFGQFFSKNLLLSVDELLDLSFSQHLNNPQYQDKKRELIEALDLKSILHKTLNSLSGGQQQRVFISKAILQALVHKEEQYSIILDEPLNNLDIRYQFLLLEYLQEKSKEGFTVIIIMHDLNFASQFCDYIGLLKEGKLISYNETENIMNESLIFDVFQQSVSINKNNNQTYVQFKTKKHEHHSIIQ